MEPWPRETLVGFVIATVRKLQGSDRTRYEFSKKDHTYKLDKQIKIIIASHCLINREANETQWLAGGEIGLETTIPGGDAPGIVVV